MTIYVRTHTSGPSAGLASPAAPIPPVQAGEAPSLGGVS